MTDSEKFAELTLPAVDFKIVRCALMDGTPVAYVQEESGIRVTLPEGVRTTKDEPDVIVVMTADREIVFKKDSNIYFTGKE